MSLAVRSLATRHFRSHPDLRLVATESLSADQRALAQSAGLGDALFGLLQSQRADRAPIVVDLDVALLLHTLTQRGPVPERLAGVSPPDRDQLLARLVYDGILQI